MLKHCLVHRAEKPDVPQEQREGSSKCIGNTLSHSSLG